MNDLENRLRQELSAFADGARPSAALAPDTLLRTYRRRTHQRRAATGAATAVLVAGAGVAVAGGAPWRTPDTRSGPAAQGAEQAPAAVAHGPKDRPLDIGRVRGSLANDRTFLAALRAQALKPKTIPGARLDTFVSVTSKDVQVYYAGDFAGSRRALVAVRGKGDNGPDVYTAWFVGPAGAPAPSLRVVESAGYARSPIDTGMNPTPGLVYLTSGPDPVLVAGKPTYSADGTARRAVRNVFPSKDGLVELDLQPSEMYALPTLGSDQDVTKGRRWMLASTYAASLPDTAVQQALPFVHAGSAFPAGPVYAAQNLAQELSTTQSLSGLPGDSTRRRYLWSGSLGGTTNGYGVVLTAPSGANLLLLVEATPRAGGGWTTMVTRTVLPAGPLDKLSVAWARVVPEAKQPDPDRPQVGSVGVIGPVGAVRARMTDRAGHVVEAPLTNGGGALTLGSPNSQGATVQFLAADGSVVATTKVVPYLTGNQGFATP